MPDQQQQINYGAAPNDGQGDPLRDAFIKTDDNFDAIWAAGPVGSNITVLNNTVSVVSTNGNLVLRPNGVGVIQANASIMPDSANIRDLGANDRRWRRVYLQTLNTVDFEVDGDLTVSGNLTIQGDTIQIGNLVTDAKTLQLSNTAANTAQATGSGITVGAADNIATLLYNSSTDTWDTNIGFAVSGNVTADYFLGNGSALSGLPAAYTDSDVTALLSSGNVSTDIFTQGNIEAAYVLGNGSQLTGLPEQYSNANVVSLLADFGSNSVVTTGNIEGGRLEIQNGIGNAWTIYGQRILAPSGGEWRSEEDSGDDFITSADDGYINIQSLYANGNIASELKLEHGVARLVVADAPFVEWTFNSSGQLDVPGNIVPDANGVYSLGSESLQWANLWVANNTIYLGGVAIGITGNTLTVAGEPVLSNDSNSDITTTGNITAAIISADYVQFLDSGSVTESYISETGFIVGSNNSATLATLQAEDVRIITDFNGGGATWTFGANGDLEAPGSITTTGNVTAGNILTDNYLYANGAPFVSASTGNITFTDTTMSPPDGVDITISAANSEVIIEAFDIRLDATDDLRLTGNDIVSLRNRSTTDSITIRTDYDNNDYVWEFAVDGTLTTPGDIVTAGDVTGTAGASTLYFKAQPASNTYIQLNNSVDSVISTVANLEVRTDVSNTAQVWIFDTNGVLTTPGNITTTGNITGGNIDTDGQITVDALSITNSSIAAATQFTISTSNTATGNSSSILMDRNGVGVVVQLQDTGGGPYSWGLYQDNILFPDSSRQYTAYANTNVAAYLPTYTGNITAGNILTDNYRYANGDPFVSSDYGDSNVVTLLSSFGSNTISTTGNITAANFIGNVSLTGNITGTSANVEIAANAYVWTFDNTGNTTFANGTVSANDITLTGNISATVDGYDIGYREIPQITLSANTTAALADSGKHFYSTTSGNLAILIPTNANVAFPTGSAFTIVVQASGNVLVNADTGVTLYMAGSSSAGNRTVGAYGMATVMKVASDTWFINGSGVY